MAFESLFSCAMHYALPQWFPTNAPRTTSAPRGDLNKGMSGIQITDMCRIMEWSAIQITI
jgi:hypothetical protein